ncbi:MAG TPA: hypothetical protein PK263_01470 [bacterium]|nr:hypothetical protein [bacterium]
MTKTAKGSVDYVKRGWKYLGLSITLYLSLAIVGNFVLRNDTERTYTTAILILVSIFLVISAIQFFRSRNGLWKLVLGLLEILVAIIMLWFSVLAYNY